MDYFKASRTINEDKVHCLWVSTCISGVHLLWRTFRTSVSRCTRVFDVSPPRGSPIASPLLGASLASVILYNLKMEEMKGVA